MKIYIYDSIIKGVFNLIGYIMISISLIIFMLFIFIEHYFSYVSILFVFIGLLILIVGSILRKILRNKRNAIIFEHDYIVFNEKKVYINQCKLRYVKLEIDLFTPFMILPFLCVNYYESKQIKIYITKRDVMKLIKMGYQIDVL